MLGGYFILKQFLFCLIVLILSCITALKLFYPIYTATEVIIPYGFTPFDICTENPDLWIIVKNTFIFTFIFSNIVLSNFIYLRILLPIFNFFNLRFSTKKNTIVYSKVDDSINCRLNKSLLNLVIGFDKLNKKHIVIPESGLYQNFLITGTIGSGKTSSSMYPFTNQLLEFNSKNINNKIGMLILDVKGNFYSQVYKYCNSLNLIDDLIIININSTVYYNPLHKPNLKPQVLANRLKTILLLFSENNSESFWLDKAEQVITECIKICRLYNDNYITFTEIHKLVTLPSYLKEKLEVLRNMFLSSKFNSKELYDFNISLDFFQKEFESLDSRTKGIIISEITRITGVFVSDYSVSKTFCSDKKSLTFSGFEEVIKEGKIVVLNMNISEYSDLSKIIATYLKLDFQSEILTLLSNNITKTTAFICDEFDKFVTKKDAEFFSMSREAKCINIVSTQSYSSLKSTLKDDSDVKVIIQNLINKIWYRTDDIFTIEEAQKQLGKEEKQRLSTSISENAKETRFSYISNTLNSDDSSISETFSKYTQNDFIFETNFFTQELETFTALTFLSDGNKVFKPQKLLMFPYFKDFISY